MAKFFNCFPVFFISLVTSSVFGLQCYMCDYTPETSKGDDGCGPEPDDRYLQTFEYTPEAHKALPLPYQIALNNDKNGYSEVPRYYCTLLVGISDGGGLMYRRSAEISVPSNPCRQIGPPYNPMSLCFCDGDKCNGVNNLEDTTLTI